MAFCRADVTRAEDWRGAVGKAVELWGRVDVLVNNAGTSYVNKVSAAYNRCVCVLHEGMEN